MEPDTILPTSVHGEATPGAEVPGVAVDIEAFRPEAASHRVEAEASQALACEAEAEVVVPAVRINS